jgi:hypothetical protein
MAHAQNPDFVFRRKGRVHINRRGTSVQSTTGSRGVRMSGSNAGYTMFRGSVKSTGYPLHSPVSPSPPLPYVTVCHHISSGYTMFRGSVTSTGYPLHSPVSPSPPLPYVTVCHHISTGLYCLKALRSLTVPMFFVLSHEFKILFAILTKKLGIL